MIGGTERFLCNLLKHLNRNEFNPVVISHIPSKPLARLQRLGIQTEVIKSKDRMTASGNLLKFIKKSRINIIQSNYYSFWMAIAAHMGRLPHIWRLGGHINEVCLGVKTREKQYFLNVISDLSERIICPSQFIRKPFDGVGKAKAIVICNGVDIGALNRRESQNDHSAVGMVAHLRPQKRHIDFIHAAKKVKEILPQTKFFIFGGVHPANLNYVKYLRKAVREIGMENDIVFTGFCDDVLTRIQQMSLITLPSINEGSSNALLEAMALARPVIASNSGGNPELIEDQVSGILVPPKDPVRLARAMIEILTNPERGRQMGEAGKKRVQKLFNITDCVRQYERLYQKVFQS